LRDDSAVAKDSLSPVRLRAQLVGRLREKGVLCTKQVADAFLAVPREKFIPSVAGEHGIAAVYRDEAYVTKTDARGMPLSSSSQPALMAKMLELLEVEPGHRVLEIGAGTGYNAALLAHLAGPKGRITSVDVDARVARQARRTLRENGYRVLVVAGDGRMGYERRAPYDRIIAAACADEIPRAWLEQLADGGRLIVPLQLDRDRSAIQVIPVFERLGDRLRSTGFTWGGFMPLHGGDGGWRPPAVTLGASRSGGDRHESLGSLAGEALARLPDATARAILASVLTATRGPVAGGLTELSSARPPLMLIYLLSRIPHSRRVALNAPGRIGVGLVDRRSRSLGIVSVRNPWMDKRDRGARRARWRLDAYGGDDAASELKQILAEWRALRKSGRTQLRVTAWGPDKALRLGFEWSGP
jgi:methyltransferase of FxLD system